MGSAHSNKRTERAKEHDRKRPLRLQKYEEEWTKKVFHVHCALTDPSWVEFDEWCDEKERSLGLLAPDFEDL